MSKMITIMVALLLFSCASSKKPWEYTHDRVGHRWPIECRQDLRQLAFAPVYLRPRDYFPQHPRVYGQWVHVNFGESIDFTFIEIDETLPQERYLDTLHHELCHEYMFRRHGNSS